MKIILSDVSKGYPTQGSRLVVMDRISLSVADGERVAILGPSGCGKTTLLRMISGLENLDSGRISVAKSIQDKPSLEMIFQQPSLLPWRTALENVLLPVELDKKLGTLEDRSRVRLAATDLLERMGLHGFMDYYPHQLSGGMRSRVAVARALITEPSILLLDEPFSALDEVTRGVLQDLLARIAIELRLTIVFVTHSVDEAITVANRVIVFSSRPARIIADIPVNLSVDSEQRRDSAETLELRSKLRGILMGNVKPFQSPV